VEEEKGDAKRCFENLDDDAKEAIVDNMTPLSLFVAESVSRGFQSLCLQKRKHVCFEKSDAKLRETDMAKLFGVTKKEMENLPPAKKAHSFLLADCIDAIVTMKGWKAIAASLEKVNRRRERAKNMEERKQSERAKRVKKLDCMMQAMKHPYASSEKWRKDIINDCAKIFGYLFVSLPADLEHFFSPFIHAIKVKDAYKLVLSHGKRLEVARERGSLLRVELKKQGVHLEGDEDHILGVLGRNQTCGELLSREEPALSGEFERIALYFASLKYFRYHTNGEFDKSFREQRSLLEKSGFGHYMASRRAFEIVRVLFPLPTTWPWLKESAVQGPVRNQLYLPSVNI